MASTQRKKTGASGHGHLDVMNRFEDMVQASVNGLIAQSDLYANLGVSGRTLRSYCQQHLGMGPARYLRFYRLKLARRALLRADPTNSTVKEISSRYGFHEAGRFAVAYRALYGDSPSVALHRALDSSSSPVPKIGDQTSLCAKIA
jgi:transcriptional regulator GlxA family with amidase domain